jgi:hypothetical protein
MRTTVDIPDAEYRLLKVKAAEEGKTIKELIHDGVKAVLAREKKKKPFRKMKLPLIKSKNPGTLVLTNEMIYDLIDFP